jgi:hypothetical protein
MSGPETANETGCSRAYWTIASSPETAPLPPAEHHQELVEAHPAAEETIAANIDRDIFLPFHPGVVGYYRDIGVDIPRELASSDG